MKLSTKGRYGLRAIFDLALNYEDSPIALSLIAERRNISLSYLEQLIAQLKRAGVVNSVRGAQGGYILSDTPDKITVGMVLRALEQLAPADCLTDDNDCSSSNYCVTRIVYKKMLDSILETIDNITLQDMIDDYNDKKEQNYTVQSIQLFGK